MIDFTNAIEEFNNYKGSEKKKTLIYDNKKYLVKFPDPIRKKIGTELSDIEENKMINSVETKILGHVYYR